MIKRLFVEKTDGSAAKKTLSELSNVLGIVPEALRVFLRYDVEGLSDADFARAVGTVFCEPPVDRVFETLPDGYDYFGIEYLPWQYDQRADCAAQCV